MYRRAHDRSKSGRRTQADPKQRKQRHPLQASLVKGGEPLRLALENIKDLAVLSVDSRGKITGWNAGAEGLFGYSEAEIIGQSFSTIFTPEDRAAGAPETEITRAHDLDYCPDDRWHLRKDGTRLFLSGTVRPLKNKSGKICGFIKVARDLTARQQMQEQLQARLRQQAAVAQLGHLALSGVDTQELMDQTMVLVTETLGVELAKVLELLPGGKEMLLRAGIGWKPGKIGHAQVGAGTASQAGYALSSQTPIISDDLRHEKRFRVLDLLEEHGVHSSITVIIKGHRNGGDPYGVLGACSLPLRKFSQDDVNFLQSIANVLATALDRNRFESALSQSEKRFRELADKLEKRVEERTAKLQESIHSLEGVLYHVAHDLRGPLRAMQGLTTLLLEKYAPKFDAEGQDYARRIANAATRMDALIRDLLAYGQLGHVKLPAQTIDLEKLAKNVLHQFADEIRASGAQIELRSPLAPVFANNTVLEQILINLISNALKFVAQSVTPYIQIWTEANGQRVRLFVQDNGIGINPAHHQRIFHVFERLHRAEDYPGTGIGLAIVMKGAERMGGRAGVESQPGQGSRFWIELPAVSKEPPVDPPPGQSL